MYLNGLRKTHIFILCGSTFQFWKDIRWLKLTSSSSYVAYIASHSASSRSRILNTPIANLLNSIELIPIHGLLVTILKLHLPRRKLIYAT